MLLDPVIGFGLSEVIAGLATGATTGRFTLFEAVPPGFTTWTDHVSTAVPTFTVVCIWVVPVAESCEDPTVRVVPPVVSTTFQPVPDPRPGPLIVSVWLALEPVIGFGLSEVMAGGGTGATTCSTDPFEALPFGLTTATVRFCAAVPTLTET